MLRELISNDWYTILFVLSLIAITLAKYLYSVRFAAFLTVIGNSQYVKRYAKDSKFVDQFNSLLFINQIIAFSTFTFIVYNQFFTPIVFDILLFLKLSLGIIGFIWLKVLLERFIANILDISDLITPYLFQKINSKNYTGLVLFPINLTLIFAVEPTDHWIYSIFILLIFINLISFITSFKTHQKLILNNFLYFILYLCTLEIAPYIILYKLLS
ncbi:MAG: DUF4271 domain-containing protein [Flavobacteriaceae bacterium]|nr:DUF4271 domain-containing protein [Flavobacteriaceae bacterium]